MWAGMVIAGGAAGRGGAALAGSLVPDLQETEAVATSAAATW
jgi:hypothetical protein